MNMVNVAEILHTTHCHTHSTPCDVAVRVVVFAVTHGGGGASNTLLLLSQHSPPPFLKKRRGNVELAGQMVAARMGICMISIAALSLSLSF